MQKQFTATEARGQCSLCLMGNPNFIPVLEVVSERMPSRPMAICRTCAEQLEKDLAEFRQATQ